MVGVLASTAGPAAAGAGSNRASIDVAGELGILSTTHATVTAAYARRLWSNRVQIEARFGLGTDGDLLIIEDRAGIGLVFTPSRRVDLVVGWRVGSSYLRGDLGDVAFSTHLLAVEAVVLIAIALAPEWRLRVVPAAPTMFWDRTYGASVGLELGVDYAF